MANSFDLAGIKLNSAQLRALLSVPTNSIPFSTYWALRNKGLVTGLQHNTDTELTVLGRLVLDDYKKEVCCRQNLKQNSPIV